MSIELCLQADGHSCGDWAHYFRCRVMQYVAEGLLGTHTFTAFLRSDMANMRGLRGTPKKQAEQHQRRIAKRRRDELRTLLCAAARSSALSWGESRLDDFVASGSAIVIDLTTLDT